MVIDPMTLTAIEDMSKNRGLLQCPCREVVVCTLSWTLTVVFAELIADACFSLAKEKIVEQMSG